MIPSTASFFFPIEVRRVVLGLVTLATIGSLVSDSLAFFSFSFSNSANSF